MLEFLIGASDVSQTTDQTPAVLARPFNGGDRVGDSFSDYANAHQLNIKSLYGWRTRLRALGHLPAVDKATSPGFVRVAAVDTASTLHKASLILPNGLRLEVHGVVDRHLLSELISAASDRA